MSHSISWTREGDILNATFAGSIARDELNQAMDEIIAHLEAVGKPIHVMLDIRQMGSLPPFALNDLPSGLTNMVQHQNANWFAIVGQDTGFVSLLLRVLVKLFGINYTAFDTPEEAVDFLTQMDSLHRTQP